MEEKRLQTASVTDADEDGGRTQVTDTATKRPVRSSVKGRLAIDAVALLVLILANNPALTGIPVHEWISLCLIIVIAVHLALNWDWTVQTLKRLVGRLRLASPANAVVDVVLFVAFVLVMLSGAMISEILAPLFGLEAAGGEMWETLHGPAGYATIGALSLHFALHWRWILRQIRFIARPISRRTRPLELGGGAA